MCADNTCFEEQNCILYLPFLAFRLIIMYNDVRKIHLKRGFRMIIMSVDLGDVRTGVAVSDNNEGFAFPRGVITERRRDVLLQKLSETAKAEGASLIVVGHPKNMDGSEGFKARECAAFAAELQAFSGIKTVLWDERCTTVSAHTALNYTDTRGKKRKAVVDTVAAVIILEDYLKFRRSSGNT